MKWNNMFAKQTVHNGIQMSLIGGWIDLAGYYSGGDGNAWAVQMNRFVNQGPIDQFIDRIKAGKIRGELIQPINALSQ